MTGKNSSDRWGTGDDNAAESTQTQHVERIVRSRTEGRVRDLKVELTAEGVLLSGRTKSFYAKQLAQHAVMDELNDIQLTNAIIVD